MRRLNDFLRGLTGLALILALLAGVPALLVLAVGFPFPTEVPSVDLVRTHIEDGDVPDVFVIKTLAVVAWLVWAQLAVAFLVELVAVARGRMSRRAPVLPGMQVVAGKLVASAMLMVSAFGPSRTAAVVPIVAPAVQAAIPFEIGSPADMPAGRPVEMPRVGGRVAAPEDASPRPMTAVSGTYTTNDGDSWWDVAERLLGDGMRWSELRDLNAGRTMPTGDVITARTESLRAGWLLVVPADAAPDLLDPAPPDGVGRAVAEALRPEMLVYEGPTGAPQAGAGPAYQVVDGDNLWDIAERHLGDPFRWPEIFEASTDLTQTFGRQVTDPNLIWPDTILVLPADAVEVPAADPQLVAEVLVGPGVAVPPSVVEPAPVAVDPPSQPEAEDLHRMAHRAAAEAERAEAVAAKAVAPEAGPRPEPTPDPDPGDAQPVDRPGESTRTAPGAAAVAGGTLLAATGLLGLLRRSRRLRLSEIGESSIPQPPPLELAEIETVLRNRADPAAAIGLIAAVTSLSPPSNRPDEPVAIPEVIRTAGGRIEAVVHDQGGAPPAPWREVRVNGGILPPGRRAVVADLAAVAGPGGAELPRSSAPPTLVSVGAGLHLNLEAVGMVAVEGEPDLVETLTRSMVHELATGLDLAPDRPAGPTVQVLVSDRVGSIDLYPSVRCGPLTRLVPETAAWLEEVELALTAAGASGPEALRRPGTRPLWPSALVVLADGAEVVEGSPLVELIERARDRRLPVAIVVVGDPADTAIHPSMTVVAADGRIRLEPLGMAATPIDLDVDLLLGVEALIDHARRAPIVPRPEPVWAMAELSVDDQGGARPLQPLGSRPALNPSQLPTEETPEHEIVTEIPPDHEEVTDRSDDDDTGLLIRVLGPVEIEGGPPDLTETQRSILAFLALAGPSTSEQIGHAVWPDTDSDGRACEADLAALRHRLGPLFPAAGDGRYRIRSTITDLGSARRWIAQAKGLSDERSRNLLHLALSEVRGRPFTGVAAGSWQWCEDHRLAIATQATSLLVDACYDLCDGAYQADDVHLALWACRVASLVDPLQETSVTRQVQLLSILGRDDEAAAAIEAWEVAFALAAGRPAPRGPRSALAEAIEPSMAEKVGPHAG